MNNEAVQAVAPSWGPLPAVDPPGGPGRRQPRQRAVATPPNINVTRIRTMISHAGKVDVLAVEVAGAEGCERWRTDAGTVNKARRDAALALAPLESCFTAGDGRVLPSVGRPGLGVCPPIAPGIVSQYWLSALSAGLVQPGTVAAVAESGARALNARATTAMRRNLGISDLSPAEC